MKDNFYRVYIGSYQDKGFPATMTIHSVVPRQHLKECVSSLIKSMKRGLDIYVKTPKDELHAIFQENLQDKFL